MTDKRYEILEHIDKIEQYAKTDPWLMSELRRRFGGVSDTRIDEIYEYCVEKIIKEQAYLFYKDFPLKELITGLKEDFVKMEFFHRRNNFDEFSMALYQQIERITNAVCLKQKLIESVSKLMGHPVYVRSVLHSDGTWSVPTISDRNTATSFQIAKLLFGKGAVEKSKKNLSAQYAVDKIYCVLYFLCYQAQLKNQEYDQFIEYKKLFNAIYQFRNLNHRGSSVSEDQQALIDNIRPQQGVYYFKFMQALLFYIEGVSKGLSELDNLYNYAQNQTEIAIKIEGPKVLGKIDLPEGNKKRSK